MVSGEAGTQTPRGALDFIVAHQGAGIFHLKDFHEPLRESAEIRRRLRDVYEQLAGPAEVRGDQLRRCDLFRKKLERSMMFLELRPPDLVELVEFLREETGEAERRLLYQVARALQGLTLDEAEYALRRALAVSPRWGRSRFRRCSKRSGCW